ncbi:YCF48-related protein [Ignavibacterium album]|nr:YCF48-related protein [Ignavibacterium album]
MNYDVGFCAAFNGIYKTTNGGDTWNLIYQDNVHYSSVQFIDENSGFAVGYEYPQNLYLVKTTNGGLSWNRILVASEEGDSKIKMINASTGFIVNENSSKIYKTADGGNSWSIVFDDSAANHPIWDLSFSDQLNGFAGYIDNKIITTSDGGDTWHKKFIPLSFCTDIQTFENHCWVAGFGVGYSAIVYSDDYGNTWTPLLVEDSLAVEDIFFNDLNNGWFCSHQFVSAPIYNGSIYKIENGWLSYITVPVTPQQIYPPNETNFELTTIGFEWEKLNYSLTRIQISTDSLFNSFYVRINPITGDTIFSGNVLLITNYLTEAFPLNQKYYWRIRSENSKGASEWSETWSFTTSSPSNVDDINSPKEFYLFQNYPNPFNPTTKIRFNIPDVGSELAQTVLKVFDILGNEVAALLNEYKPAGTYEVNFDASHLSSGVYFYQLKAGNFTQTRKMILLK